MGNEVLEFILKYTYINILLERRFVDRLIVKNNIYGVIYKIENKINNKVYIGQTTRKNGFDDRYPFKGKDIERLYNFYNAQKRYGESYNEHLLLSIKKYGFKSFEVDKKFDKAYSKEELDEKEKFWIKYYNSTDKNYGYNHLIGGDGFIYGKKAYINKLGGIRKPIICLETNEVFLTIRDASKDTGICENMIRHVCTGKFKYAYSMIYDTKLTFDYIETNKKSGMPVICITTNDKFKTAKDASKLHNICISSIVKNCDGKNKSAGRDPVTNEKLIWKYQLDYLLEVKLIN